MKKFLLATAIISVCSLGYAKNVIEVRAGYDVSYDVEADGYDVDSAFDNGPNIALEYRKELFPNFELGGGFEYQYNKLKTFKTTGDVYRSFTTDDSGLNSFPVYITARYNFNLPFVATPYVRANLGYSFNSGGYTETENVTDPSAPGSFTSEDYDFKDGFYYSVGAGITYMGFLADIAFEGNNFEAVGKYLNSSHYNGTDYENSYKDETIDFRNYKLKLSIGYQLGF